MFPYWLEYSPANDGAYCLTCYLFSSKPYGRFGSDVFTKQGFRSWRKVNARKRCAFLNHIGDSPCSPHNSAMKACEDLLNQSMHINNIINIQSSDKSARIVYGSKPLLTQFVGSHFKLVHLEATRKHQSKCRKSHSRRNWRF